ncbi:MAG: hypothetical protein ACW98X_01735 [Promethearchaeota archaeon]|jgi:hypothetical protein
MGESSKNYNLTILGSILLLLGSYTFSYILGLIFHESGHALAYTIVGIPNIRIHVHPFALSYCSSGFRPPEVLPFTGSMGPILNLVCSSIISLSLWRKRNPKLLPLLMCAGTAYISEGIGIIIDLVDLPLLTDWGKVMIIGGVSPIIIGIIGVVFLIIGSIFMLLLMPLQNISHRDVFWKRLLITTSISVYFLLSVIYTSIFDASTLEWRLYAFFSALGFSILLTAIYKPIFPYLDRLSHTETTSIPRSAIIIALGSALGIIIFVLIFFP